MANPPSNPKTEKPPAGIVQTKSTMLGNVQNHASIASLQDISIINGPSSEVILIEEMYLSEKRKAESTIDQGSDARPNKRNIRETRSGKEVPTIGLKRKPTDKMNIDLPMPHTPYLANRKKMSGVSKFHLLIYQNVEEIVERIIKIKCIITKPQTNKAGKTISNKTGVALISEETSAPKGKSAPRTSGEINGVKCDVILDGGCTSFIISLNLSQQLGICDAEPCDTAVMFGSSEKVVSINALSYDVGDQYGFIIGREGMLPLDIYYTKQRMRNVSDNEEEFDDHENDHLDDGDLFIDQDDVEEGYLITEVTDLQHIGVAEIQALEDQDEQDPREKTWWFD
ncbi:hypothetical protein BD560DRAFT_438993 [Blakeslea trispora]|nr:hypothetical protein BD560DRAFT_438993 [Blakeslea trispora]